MLCVAVRNEPRANIPQKCLSDLNGIRRRRKRTRPSIVSFEEALTVFADPLARIFPDEEHSVAESREIIIGHSDSNQLILVNFTGIDDRVRIFSAR